MAITDGTCKAKDALTLHIPSTCTCVSSVQVLHTPAVKGSLWHPWKDTEDKATTLADGYKTADVTVCAYYLLQSYQGRGSRKPSTPSKTSFKISVCTCAHMCVHVQLSKEKWRHLSVIPQFNSEQASAQRTTGSAGLMCCKMWILVHYAEIYKVTGWRYGRSHKAKIHAKCSLDNQPAAHKLFIG